MLDQEKAKNSNDMTYPMAVVGLECLTFKKSSFCFFHSPGICTKDTLMERQQFSYFICKHTSIGPWDLFQINAMHWLNWLQLKGFKWKSPRAIAANNLIPYFIADNFACFESPKPISPGKALLLFEGALQFSWTWLDKSSTLIIALPPV